MPYKDIEKQREAYRRWLSKNLEKRREYQRILIRAKKAHPEKMNCSVNGCDNPGEKHHPDYSKPEQIVWLCKTHHELVHHPNRCSICQGKIIARGFCNKHYKSERKKIDPEYARMEKIRRERARKSQNPCPLY